MPRRPSALLRWSLGLAASAAATAGSLDASAQDQLWLRDRRYTEGPGIRVGNFELHPGVAAEVGYDTNYLRRSDDAGAGGAVRFRITPSLSLSTLGPQRTEGSATSTPPDVEFRGTLSLTYNEFIGVAGPDAIRNNLNNQRNLSGNLDLSLAIFPRREWSGSIYAGVGRTAQPNEQGLFDSFRGTFDRILTRGGGELVWTPGAGLLDWRLGYRFSGTVFEQVGGLTNVEHTIQTRGRWRFLPRTAMLYDARFGFINYVSPGGGAQDGFKGSSHPLRVQLGVNGLITPSFGILAMGGWGASFYEPVGQNNDFDSFIGQAEVKWYITPNPSTDPMQASMSVSSVSLGFIRDFSDSLVGTYVERNRGYANLTWFFGGRFLVVVDGGVGPVVYPALDRYNGVDQGLASWTDIRWDASVFGEYRLKDYFGINALVRYSGNASPTSLQAPPDSDGQQGPPDSLQWQSFEAYLGARFMM